MLKKRLFDLSFSLFFFMIILPFLIILIIIASIDTKSFGLFIQERVGQNGHLFLIYKIKTFRNNKSTNIGILLRKYKIDELPQFFNILIGNMSFVGPRPDIKGYYDELEGENRKVLKLKPGLTCPASIKYFNEEELLSKQTNPEKYNSEVIFPDKIKMNLDYYYNRSFLSDLLILWRTIFK